MSLSAKQREKVFRDSVHGYIRIPAVIAKVIIDTSLFQRLRNIEQTSMRPLFPAARHDRFVHSLGTYHLGCQAFDAVRENSDLTHLCPPPPAKDRESYLDRRRVLFTLACLLHDCAHAPFSHTFEVYYDLDTSGEGESPLRKKLLSEYSSDPRFESDYNVLCNVQRRAPAPHECMSALMVKLYFREAIQEVVSSLCDDSAPVSEDELALIARMIIGCTYTGNISVVQSFDNCLIQLLNSSTIDVDGLDYTIRDSKNSGFNNWTIDCDRLLRSVRVVEAANLIGCTVKDASLHGIFLTNTRFNASIDDGKRFTGEIADIGGSFKVAFENKADTSRLDIDQKTEGIVSEDGHTVAVSDSRKHHLGGCVRPYAFTTKSGCKLSLKSWSGSISGTVLRPPDTLSEQISDGEARCAYVLVFDKSSISVIDGAIDARNLLYKRVYSHPQVLYQSTFLKHYLLKLCAKYLCCKEHLGKSFYSQRCPIDNCSSDCPLIRSNSGRKVRKKNANKRGVEYGITQILGLSGFFNPTPEAEPCSFGGWRFDKSDDNDLLALFKWVYLDNHYRPKNTRSEEIERFFTEFFSRTGKKPIWKSPEELRHFMALQEEKGSPVPFVEYDKLVGANTSLSSNDYLFVDEKDDSVREYIDAGYTNLLAIRATRKTKVIDYTSTFIWFPDGVERYSDVAHQPEAEQREDFVYLFYDPLDKDHV